MAEEPQRDRDGFTLCECSHRVIRHRGDTGECLGHDGPCVVGCRRPVLWLPKALSEAVGKS